MGISYRPAYTKYPIVPGHVISDGKHSYCPPSVYVGFTSHVPLLTPSIIEPGYYEDGLFGIRTESKSSIWNNFLASKCLISDILDQTSSCAVRSKLSFPSAISLGLASKLLPWHLFAKIWSSHHYYLQRRKSGLTTTTIEFGITPAPTSKRTK